MFTENYTEETTKIYEMTKVIFTEVICYSNIAERTEWIFPGEAMAKRSRLAWSRF